MSRTLLDHVRKIANQLFGSMKDAPRPQRRRSVRLGLEQLECRDLLSASPVGSVGPLSLMEAGQPSGQASMSYVLGQESTAVSQTLMRNVAAAQTMVKGFEQWAANTIAAVQSTLQTRIRAFEQWEQNAVAAVESNLQRMVNESERPNLLSSTGAKPLAQTGSMIPGQPAERASTGSISSDQPTAAPSSLVGSSNGVSPAGSSSPSQIGLTANFTGIGPAFSYPPDTNAAVGPNSVIEVANSTIAIYDKTGKLNATDFHPIAQRLADAVVLQRRDARRTDAVLR